MVCCFQRNVSDNFQQLNLISSLLTTYVNIHKFSAKSLAIDGGLYFNGVLYVFQPPPPVKKNYKKFYYHKWSELSFNCFEAQLKLIYFNSAMHLLQPFR